mmetsp:Transcript_3233/g.10103  ORF Transcript_3233/g.10103 Transcript_3233/m.10103 type:complete len:217 (-) Transcript_3233:2905-3555(-)
MTAALNRRLERGRVVRAALAKRQRSGTVLGVALPLLLRSAQTLRRAVPAQGPRRWVSARPRPGLRPNEEATLVAWAGVGARGPLAPRSVAAIDEQLLIQTGLRVAFARLLQRLSAVIATILGCRVGARSGAHLHTTITRRAARRPLAPSRYPTIDTRPRLTVVALETCLAVAVAIHASATPAARLARARVVDHARDLVHAVQNARTRRPICQTLRQ